MKAFGHFLTPLALAGLSLLAACSTNAVDTPPLAATAQPPAEQSDWLQNTGDAAWNAVARPVNGLMLKPKPRPDPAELVPADPPEMVIITRDRRGVVTAEPPATTQP